MSASTFESNEAPFNDAPIEEKAAAVDKASVGEAAVAGETPAGAQVPAEGDLPTSGLGGEEETGELVEEPEEVEEPVPKPSPVGLRTAWEEVRRRYEARLHKLGRKPAGLSRYVKGAREFIEWAIQRGYSPERASAEWKQVFTAHVDSLAAARITKNVNRLAGVGMIEEAMASPEEQVVEEYDDAPEGETEEGDGVDEAPAPKRRATPPVPPQVVFVQAPGKAPRQPKATAQPRARRLFASEQVRIYKRNFAGKKVYLSDYDVSDIGTSLHRFIKEFVDNDFHEPSGRTTYEVFQLGADGKELGSPASVTIESAAEPPPDDEMQKARSAVELIRDLRELDDEKMRTRQELLNEAQKKAVSSGDMTQLMMLMMMQNIQQPRNEVDVASRVLEHLKSSGKAHEVFPMPPPPPLPPPMPIAAPVSEEDKAIKTVTAKVLEKTLEPKPEKSTMEFAKELAAIRELFAPQKQEDPEMKLLLKTVIEKMAAPAQQSGLDAIVSQFGKIKEVVTTLAPQVNAGGLVGALQSIITPQLGAALGNVIAAGLEKSKAFQGAPAPAASVAAAPAKPAGPSPQVAAAIASFRAAADEPGQVVTAYQLMGVLYDDAAYKAKMEPALLALMQQKTEPAVKLALELLKEIRPDLANDRFARKVTAHLIRSNGGTPPADLEGKTEAEPEPTPVAEAKPSEPRESPVPKQGELLRDKEPDVVVATPVGPKQGEALREKDEPANGKVTELPAAEQVVEQPAPKTAVA